MNNNDLFPTNPTLKDIQMRKRLLLNDIRKDSTQISKLWLSLFSCNNRKEALTPSKKLNFLLSSGTNVIDGMILGWKLYRKFKKKR